MEPFEISLGGVKLTCQPRFAQTCAYFSRFRDVSDNANLTAEKPVSVPDAHWETLRAHEVPACAASECSELSLFCSDALLPFDRAVFHSSALRYHDQAWLLCGRSGIGKSTQTKWLDRLCPDAFSVISGDRPVVELQKDGVIVHPSPWNGKEDWYGAEAAPLAGLILIERGEENKIEPLTPKKAAFFAFLSVLNSGWEEAFLFRAASFADRLLRAVPIWKLTSNQVPDSTRLLLSEVFS